MKWLTSHKIGPVKPYVQFGFDWLKYSRLTSINLAEQADDHE